MKPKFKVESRSAVDSVSGKRIQTQTLKIDYKVLKFSGGELHTQAHLPENLNHPFVVISGNVKNATNEKELVLLVNSLRKSGKVENIHIYLKYLPYSRQDRVCEVGDADSCQIFLDTLKLSGATKVHTLDIHSKAFLRKNLDFVESAPVEICFEQLLCDSEVQRKVLEHRIVTNQLQLIAPDESAVTRVKDILKAILPNDDDRFTNVAHFEKVREQSTGGIISYKLAKGSKLYGKKLLLIDDICDGGYTFKLASEEIQRKGYQVKAIELYTTHGIYSKGLDSVKMHFNAVYCFNNIKNNKKQKIDKYSFLF